MTGECVTQARQPESLALRTRVWYYPPLCGASPSQITAPVTTAYFHGDCCSLARIPKLHIMLVV